MENGKRKIKPIAENDNRNDTSLTFSVFHFKVSATFQTVARV